MSMDNKVPEVRFKGFSGEWEENTLSEIANVIDPHPSHRAPDAVDNGIPFIGIGDISDVGLVDLKNVRIVSSSVYNEHSARYTIEKGDFAYGRVASVGKIIDLSNNVGCIYTYSPTMAIVKPTNVYPAYLRNYLQTKVFKDLVANKTSGSTRKSLGVQDFRCLPVLFPLKEEQAAIGNYIQKLDTLINQHQQKHDKLSNIKKAMLEKMFPKQGETMPEIRFKGFSGEWTVKLFGVCFANVPINTLSRADLNYSAGSVKNIHYGDVLIKFGEVLDVRHERLPFITNDSVANKLNHAALQDGDIIIADAAEDSTVGKCTELLNIDEQLVVSGLHTIAARPTLSFASKYLGYYLNSSSFHDQLLSLMQGTKVLSISKKTIQNTSVIFPKSSKEQAAIGNYFQKLDALINQHQQKITKLNNIKQACLSKMFV
ncbi:restriction endonuclease subunit S [Arsenophonus nasoniae]|uniref:Restriction endonuclease subunit S n=2 Tax=Arsenophonus nasoniae TaxID=638 RepID=A0AA95GRP7_9GAMM|nr:restriction endonuclease subunit S [Arsenophonus nasoniae]WGM03658.1 restriction endonuclease subunit S [Arsenophonus nasoniae]